MENIDKFIQQFKIMLINLDSLFLNYKKRKNRFILLKQKELDCKGSLLDFLSNQRLKRKMIQEQIVNLNNELLIYDNDFFKFRKIANQYIFEYIEKYAHDYSLTDNEYRASFQCLKNIYVELTKDKEINIDNLKKSSNLFLLHIKNIPKPERKVIVITDNEPPGILSIKYDSIGDTYTWMKDRLHGIYQIENNENYGLNKNIIPILLPSTNSNKLLIPNFNQKTSEHLNYNVSDRHNDYITYCGLSLDDDVEFYEKYYDMIPLIFKENISIFEGTHESLHFLNVNVHSLFQYYSYILKEKEKAIYKKKDEYGVDLFEFLDMNINPKTNEWTALSVINSRNVGYRCSCCGKLSIKHKNTSNQETTSTLDAHEMWKMELDKNEKIFKKKLVDIISLCENCHMVFHGENWGNKKNIEYDYIQKIIGGPDIIEERINENKYQIEIDASIIANEDCLKSSKFIKQFQNIIMFQGYQYEAPFVEDYSSMKM